jgi:hypothetical protein
MRPLPGLVDQAGAAVTVSGLLFFKVQPCLGLYRWYNKGTIAYGKFNSILK